MNEKVRVHVFIKGRVQGVFFRENTRAKAGELGVKGWVRNLPDGRVEMVFEGLKSSVERAVGWTKKGPPLARVDGIDIQWQESKREFDSFEIKY